MFLWYAVFWYFCSYIFTSVFVHVFWWCGVVLWWWEALNVLLFMRHSKYFDAECIEYLGCLYLISQWDMTNTKRKIIINTNLIWRKKIISGFEDIIINHFRLKKTIILHQVSIWAEEATCRWSAKLKAHHKKLVILLNALDNILWKGF